MQPRALVLNLIHCCISLLIELCMHNFLVGLADNRQRFTRVYRTALNVLSVERPICNLRLAAYWDCVYKNFYKFCYNEFITMCKYENISQTEKSL